jgi:hypothetical protein
VLDAKKQENRNDAAAFPLPLCKEDLSQDAAS